MAHGGAREFVRYFGAGRADLRARAANALGGRGSPRGGRRSIAPSARRPAAQEGVGGHAPAARTLQLGQARARSGAAGDGERVGIDGDDLAGPAAGPAARRAAPAGDGLAIEHAARARKRVEGAQAPLDRRRRLAPVDAASRLGDLGRVGHAGLGLRRGRQRRLRSSARQRLDDELGAERGQARLQDAGGVVGARSATRLAEQHGAGVEAGVHLHDGDAGVVVAGFDRALDRRRAAPARQQRGVDVEAAVARQREQPGRQDQAVGGDDDRRRAPPRQRVARAARRRRRSGRRGADRAAARRRCRAPARTP